ncbi:MAG: hypothetical protein LBD25_02300, partial [Coriobacteriales bacterium]|nr:hypothetical protein [Coriobacteriales bacterium]
MTDLVKFHADVNELYQGLVKNALEFVGHEAEVEKVFVYGDMEGSYSCFFLYAYLGDIYDESAIADARGYSPQQSREKSTLAKSNSNEKLITLQGLFTAAGQEPPKSIKLTYDVKKRSLDAELSHVKVRTQTYYMSDVEERWRAELRLAAGLITEEELPGPPQHRAVSDKEYEKSFR